MRTIKIGGIDPSLRNTGLAKATYDLGTGDWSVSQVLLIPTDADDSKQVRKSSDDLRCCRHIVKRLHEHMADCDVIFGEIPGGAQSARAARSFGMVVGFMGGWIETPNLRPTFMEVSPQEVKLAIPGGSKTTSKEEIVCWAYQNWPDAGWSKNAKGKFEVAGGVKLTADNEHMGDACAAIAAGVRTQQFIDMLAAFRIAFRSQ